MRHQSLAYRTNQEYYRKQSDRNNSYRAQRKARNKRAANSRKRNRS